MSFEDFKAALANDQEKAKAFQEALAAAAEKGVENETETLVQAAAAAGFELTAEEAERALASVQELDEEELSHVSGGWWGLSEDNDGHDIWCLGFLWHCFITFLHTDGGTTNEACWENYDH